ncbi:hypothetical protein CDD81_6411 [Ophiocordyceps australis]|uniref:Small ribosomal subunit protein bS18m n=1 Tax=Ophiocordyceps australis TaxID=1399860 RepID=A0A2C5Y5L9_9HYPO|nr:hypothetical protein CDD81_6411 [Ophiocordyceps australis]
MAPRISSLQRLSLRLPLRALFSSRLKGLALPNSSQAAFSTDKTLSISRRTAAAAAANAATSKSPKTDSRNSIMADKLLSIVRSSSSRKGAAPTKNFGKASKDLYDRFKARYEMPERRDQIEEESKRRQAAEYLTQMPRRFHPGDLYSPHDLSSAEMSKFRRRPKKTRDIVDTLGLNPLDHYKNFSLISQFTSSSGQILKAEITALRTVNQRKVAKMIRRAQGMGIYPKIHSHPELLRNDFYPGSISRDL